MSKTHTDKNTGIILEWLSENKNILFEKYEPPPIFREWKKLEKGSSDSDKEYGIIFMSLAFE